jgi:MoaA/NifB/PqqE/SkfB family radical SAM enzyme
MSDNAFEMLAPWKIDEDAEMILNINDEGLLGSRQHLIRFDLYPMHAPSHPARHYGYWDIPMNQIRWATTKLVMKGDTIHIKDDLRSSKVRPAWRGSIPLAGQCLLTVSILKRRWRGLTTIGTKSYQHLLLGKDDDVPVERVTVYVTRRCNLDCDMCWRGLFKTSLNQDTPSEVIDAVVEASSELASVLLHGDGEPLLNPMVFDTVTRLKKKMRSAGRVGVFTNGMLLDGEAIRRLVGGGINWIQVSLDGATESTNEQIRRGSSFQRIVNNIDKAVAYGKKTRTADLDFTIQFTARQANAHELPDLVKLGSDLGVDNICVAHLIDFGTGKYCPVSPEVLTPSYREASRVARELGVRLLANPATPLDSPHCNHLHELFVYTSGDVSPCCFRRPGNPEKPVYLLGNIKEKPLWEIQRSLALKTLRKSVIETHFPKACSGCECRTLGCYLPL